MVMRRQYCTRIVVNQMTVSDEVLEVRYLIDDFEKVLKVKLVK